MVEGVTESHESDAYAEIARLREHIERLEQRVEHLDALAHLDPLVGLPNRRGFMRELEALIARVSRYGEKAAMLFVDFDGLKRINDSHGHKAGDEALIRVAAMLGNGVRKSDTVARLGGDEFGILLAHTDEQQACETAQRLMSEIDSSEMSYEGGCLPLGVAVGMTVIAADDTTDAVIARADRAMYKEKSAA